MQKPINTTHNGRDMAIEAMRIAAIAGVVLIHTTTRMLEAAGYDVQHANLSLLLNQFSRFAAPLFYLISGFALSVSTKSIGNVWVFWRKRLVKILVPYVVWSALYYYVLYTRHTISFIESLIGGNSSYQLYFIPTLILFYLLFPLLYSLRTILFRPVILTALVLVQIAVLNQDYYSHSPDMAYPIKILFFNTGVFVAGMWLAQHKDRIATWAAAQRWILAVAAIAAGCVVWWEGRANFLATHNYVYFYSQWRPSVFIYTVLVALAGYGLLQQVKFGSAAAALARVSFFVFFIHVLVLEELWTRVFMPMFGRIGLQPPGYWLIELGYFGLTFAISAGVGLLVQQSRAIRTLTG